MKPKKSELLKVLETGGNASTWKEIIDLPAESDWQEIAELYKQIVKVCALSGGVAHDCDHHGIRQVAWWRAVQKLQKMAPVLTSLTNHNTVERSHAAQPQTESEWLCDVLHKVEADIDKWPDWLRKAAGVCVRSPRSDQPPSSAKTTDEPCPHPQCDAGWLKSEDESEIGQPCHVCSPAKTTDAKQEWAVEPVRRSTGETWTGLAHINCGGGRLLGSMNEQVALAVIATHNAALAAERQRREQAEKLQKLTEDNLIRWMRRCEQFEQQLLSALAAIEKHNGTPEHLRSLGDIKTDLSALREHDAEVRAPLADALEKYVVAMDGLYNHNAATRKAVVQFFGTLHPPTAIDALAKVKEGK